ncbi:MAG: hypothetical protein IKU86_08310, partial [Thermoguttaceae bacterium]|nr:hypothetical protein [Thermoguttaceae bacterium]
APGADFAESAELAGFARTSSFAEPTKFAPLAAFARVADSWAARIAKGFCAATAGGGVCAFATPPNPTANKESAAIRRKRRDVKFRDVQSIGTCFAKKKKRK